MLGHARTLLNRATKTAAQQQRLFKVMIAHGIALAAVRGISSVEMQTFLEDARTMGQSMQISPENIVALGSQVVISFQQGHLHETRRLGEEILALARTDGSPNALRTGHWAVGVALMGFGEIGAAVSHLECAVADADIESRDSKPPDSSKNTCGGSCATSAGTSHRRQTLNSTSSNHFVRENSRHTQCNRGLA
jgi:hypothetical protein